MITAKRTIDAEVKDIAFGRIIINLDNQRVIFQLTDGHHEHKLTENQWNYLVNGLQALMNNIPKITNVVIPPFNPNIE